MKLEEAVAAWAKGNWDARPTQLNQAQSELWSSFTEAIGRARREEQQSLAAFENGVSQAGDHLAAVVVQGQLTHDRLPAPHPGLIELFGVVNESTEMLVQFVEGMRTVITQLTTTQRRTQVALTIEEGLLADQATSAREVATTLAELKATSTEIERQASLVTELSREATRGTELALATTAALSQVLQRVRTSAVAVVEATQVLSRSMLQVDAVVKLIEDVAARSDILALNAALESARAGDAGQGFAFVADEMRRLAARVLNSTRMVTQLVEEVRAATQTVRHEAEQSDVHARDGDREAQTARTQLITIAQRSRDTSDAMLAIQMATQQQRDGSSQAAEAVEDLSAKASAVLEAGKTTRESAQQMGEFSERLEALVKRFSALDPK